MIKQIVVAGAGTMGSGIALAAALGGCKVVLYDSFAMQLEKAKTAIENNVDFLLNKGKINAVSKTEILRRIIFSNHPEHCIGEIIIEAIVEIPEAKIELLQLLLPYNSKETILASNTSSLSITNLQSGLPGAERVAGLHFFNPANVMKLVEVVKGTLTSDDVISKLVDFCKQINKTPVVCKDAPGFIVNRVARHFYLESLHLVESGLASPATVDAAMEAAGFKMGPFKLMDLIGIDINCAVSESLYKAFDDAIRFTPSLLQKQKIQEGKLGRKTGEGFYKY